MGEILKSFIMVLFTISPCIYCIEFWKWLKTNVRLLIPTFTVALNALYTCPQTEKFRTCKQIIRFCTLIKKKKKNCLPNGKCLKRIISLAINLLPKYFLILIFLCVYLEWNEMLKKLKDNLEGKSHFHNF